MATIILKNYEKPEIIFNFNLSGFASVALEQSLPVLVALVINLFLSRWIEPRATPLLLAAVAVAAWRGGKFPSLLATALAVFALDFFFQPPIYSLEPTAENVVNAVVFVAVALLVSWIDGEREKAARERDALLESDRAARRRAEDASREKDEFLAMITHDLRSPLNAVLGWTNVLQKSSLDDREQVGKALAVIERNCRMQMRLVEDLLDISRIRTGKLRVRLEPVDLRSIVEESIESVAATVEAKNIRLYRESDGQVGLVNGDAERLRQIVWNLLSNAVKFTPEAGQIEVRLEKAGAYARLTVYDTGDGISPNFLPFIFDSYRQSEEGGRAKHKGLGLGLAIVRRLVEAHGGAVRAASAGINLGATFTVELPMVSETLAVGKSVVETGSAAATSAGCFPRRPPDE